MCRSLLLLTLTVASLAHAQVVLQPLDTDAMPGVNRLQSAGFGDAAGATSQGWGPWDRGFSLRPDGGRDGGPCAEIASDDREAQFGVSQTVALKQQRAAPIVASAWSRAEGVTGVRDSGYSLYLDIIYMDGDHLWGQVTGFRVGTHDWERQRVTVIPPKPIDTVTVHLLFRGHTGSVRFDDASLVESDNLGGAALFDGVPVSDVPDLRAGISTAWGCDLGRGQELLLDASGQTLDPSGRPRMGLLLVRDVAASGPFVRVAGDLHPDGVAADFEGAAPELGLSVEARLTPAPEGGLRIDGTLTADTPADRAVTLYVAIPASGMTRWHDDVETDRALEAPGTYAGTVGIAAGATGQASRYPLACVSGEALSRMVAVPLDKPAVCRLAYDARLEELYVGFDFGLAPETKRPASARFSVVVHDAAPEWGFRSALAWYQSIQPEGFRKRADRGGIWMPFTNVSSVEGWEDFGFAFHEGDTDLAWDAEHGVLSFVYVEPMSCWLPLDKDTPRSREAAVARMEQLASEGNDPARAVLSSGAKDDAGQWDVDVVDAPWCDGAVFTVEADPDISPEPSGLSQHGEKLAIIERAMAAGPLGGTYIDSFEGWAMRPDHRREHFAAADVPLTFSSDTAQPMILTYFSTYEFSCDLAERMWSSGRLMFANAMLWNFPWAAHSLDVMGTETNWLQGGRYQPDSHEIFRYRRAMCGTKPYLLLQNTVYDDFPIDMVERYMKRSVFYGVYPSFFSHDASNDPYWQRPVLYNAHRSLFLRYIPLCRQLDEAGWEPVPYARAETPGLLIERYGDPSRGRVLLALFGGDEATTRTLRVDAEPLGVRLPCEAKELLTGRSIAIDAEGRANLDLAYDDLAVLELPMAR